MAHNDYYFDAICVGGGPSGLMAALELAGSGASVALIEKGGDMRESLCAKVRANLKGNRLREAEKFRYQCARCTCLEGLGGAAFHFDTNLGYFNRLSRSKIERAPDGSIQAFSGLERTIGSFELAQDLIAQVYETLFRFGVPRAHSLEPGLNGVTADVFDHVDLEASQPVTLEAALRLIEGIGKELSDLGAEIMLHTFVKSVRRADAGWYVDVVKPDGREESLRSRVVIVGVGKPALDWINGVLKETKVDVEPSRRVDIGVRIETPRENMEPIASSCHNPKLSFLNARGDAVRTFCICRGGRLMQYDFAGVVVLDGQHCLELATQRTNFGVVTTTNLGPGEDGTALALEYASRVNRLGDGGPVVQRVDELLGCRAAGRASVHTSLAHYESADLRTCLPPSLIADIEGMIHRLNGLYPGSVPDDAVVAAPVIDKINPWISLSTDMESSERGLYFVGECSAKVMGITYGAVTGIVAARAALKERI